MDSHNTKKLREVLENAGALAVALRMLSRSNRVAGSLLELLERDITRLSSAVEADKNQTILLALAFPSLDGRAADALGGFDMESNPETSNLYRLLNLSLVAAIEAVGGDSK